jgi:hypothetical protein
LLGHGRDNPPKTNQPTRQRTVAFIIGTSYCGSSLLKLLLDALPGVSGLGEAVHLSHPDGPAHCNLCRRGVRDCAIARRVDANRFYASLFDVYAGCTVLVDSSKSLASCVGAHPVEPQFACKAVLLSKSPHEFAWSWIGHHPWETPAAAFRRYIDYYTDQLEQRALATCLSPWDWRSVT